MQIKQREMIFQKKTCSVKIELPDGFFLKNLKIRNSSFKFFENGKRGAILKNKK